MAARRRKLFTLSTDEENILARQAEAQGYDRKHGGLVRYIVWAAVEYSQLVEEAAEQGEGAK
jgi:hypothetical protein